MVGEVTFGTRKAGRGGGSGFVLARCAGSTDSVVQSRSLESCGINCGSTFETHSGWAGCVGHVVASRFVLVLTGEAAENPTQTVDDGAVGGAGCGGVGGGEIGAAPKRVATVHRSCNGV